MSTRRLSLLLVLWCLPLMGQAAPPGGWQVTELRLNTPTMGGSWYPANSPLSRGLHVDSGYVGLYAVEVLPGLEYTVQLSVPHGLKRIRVFLYDRWPMLLKARAVQLPTGPVVVTPRSRRVTYRWRVGISARSTGSLLYVLVHYPRNPGHHRAYAPRLLVGSPPLGPQHQVGQGITYLQGPRQLVLYGDRAPVAYVFQPAAPASPRQPRPTWTVPGDLISNARFAGGLKNWVPVDSPSGSARGPDVDTAGLVLPAGAGVRQQLDADVTGARSLVLWADLRLDAQAGAGDALRHSSPGFSVDICYRDARDQRHCHEGAYEVNFYPGEPGSADSPLKDKGSGTGELVPSGRWVRYQTDLSELDPAPVRIESIALRADPGAGAARVREVHLILGSHDHGQP